jgi:ABC-type transport system substrate-binding protein
MNLPQLMSLVGRRAGGPQRQEPRMPGLPQRRWWTIAGSLALVCLLATLVVAQQQEADEEEEEEQQPKAQVAVELTDREPFDQLTLTAANGNAVVEILPLANPPTNLQPTDRLRIRLVKNPQQDYEVTWQDVAKYRSYNQLVFEEAQQLVQDKKYNAAFRNFDYLLKHTTPTPGLRNAVLEYLLVNASEMLAAGKTDHALAVFEELLQRDRDFRATEVAGQISRAADTLISQEVDRGDFAQARAVMTRLEARYGSERIATLATWRQRFIDQATDLKRQAEQMVTEGKLREAEQRSRRMVAIWPDLAGAQKLRDDIVLQYPMVIVGVAEAAGRQDATSIDSWSARRTGRLTQRTLMEFNGAGPEGGQYLCAFGEYSQSDDRRGLTLELNSAAHATGGAPVDGYTVARRVTELADPASPSYEPEWAALAQRVSVSDVFRVNIELRRPHVLPEAMLQVRIDAGTAPPGTGPRPGDGPFTLVGGNAEDLHFVARADCKFASDSHPREIVERHFQTTEEAIGALRRGDIDAIDVLFPDDAVRLADDKTLRVIPYALPTIHVLMPNHQNLFTANQTFRRAIAYGIDRQAILDADVLGNQKVPGCQLISGPFPIGTYDNDPLAYAYNPRVPVRSYNPRLASILNMLARRELTEKAEKRGETVPAETKIVLGFPGSQLARVTCQAISQYLATVGITCELRELPPDADPNAMPDLDLVYKQVAMWEPIVDARRLLAPQGVAAVSNEYVGMALRRLDAAKNWREVRERLHDLHRIVDEQVAIIPLWQTVNYLVHAERVSGVGQHPLTLYQDVEQWQVAQPGEPN